MCYQQAYTMFLILFIAGSAVVSGLFPDIKELSPSTEMYSYSDSVDYVFSSNKATWEEAWAICRHHYEGRLASLHDEELERFIGRCMAESQLSLDAMWVDLKRTSEQFLWLEQNIPVEESEFSCVNAKVQYKLMDCGVVVRKNHSDTCLAQLSCRASRGYICVIFNNETSTHYDWIRLGNRLYKIFSRRITYNDAITACYNHDRNSVLAVVDKYDDVKILARYLLTGRPGIENAWIGARWNSENGQYEFEFEPVILSDSSDEFNYPPWPNGQVSVRQGCILLDRHLHNTSVFLPARCNLRRPYICHKLVKNTPMDVCTVGRWDWRIYYKLSSWHYAYRTCTSSANTGRLAVIEKEDMKAAVYIMEATRTYLLHAWLGALFTNNTWTWMYTNVKLPRVESSGYPPWVVNGSYSQQVEKNNLCLNIDRENAVKVMFYGTLCGYPQSFICQYDKGTICRPLPSSTISITMSSSTTPTTFKTTTTTTSRTTTTATTATPQTTTTTTAPPATTTTTTPNTNATTTAPKTTTTATTLQTTTTSTTPKTTTTTTTPQTTTRTATPQTTTTTTTTKTTTTTTTPETTATTTTPKTTTTTTTPKTTTTTTTPQTTTTTTTPKTTTTTTTPKTTTTTTTPQTTTTTTTTKTTTTTTTTPETTTTTTTPKTTTTTTTPQTTTSTTIRTSSDQSPPTSSSSRSTSTSRTERPIITTLSPSNSTERGLIAMNLPWDLEFD